jgi:hypothetical protein
MYEQIFDAYRRASESWLQVHQDMFRPQQWLMSSSSNGVGGDWNKTFQKRCLELAVEILNRQRESVDTIYKSMVHLLEQTSRISEARSPDEYRRLVEDVWRDWFESMKSQSETQFRDVQSWAGKSLEIVKSAQA